MLTIPAPVPPELPAAAAWGGVAGGVVVAVVLVLWGRIFGRLVLALVAAGVGLLIAPWLAGAISLELWIVQIAAGAAAGLIGLIAARFVWPLVIGAIFAATAAVVLVWHYLAQAGEKPKSFPAFDTFGAYWTALWEYAKAHVADVWSGHAEVLLAVTALAAIVPIVVGLIRPRLATIFTTSLLGGTLLVAAIATGGMLIWPTYWTDHWSQYFVALGIVGGCLLVGLVFQYRGAILADRAGKRVGAEPLDKDQT